MSPYDALMMSWLVLAGKSVHAPGQLSENGCSEQRCQSRYSSPSFGVGKMVAPGANCDIYIHNATYTYTNIHILNYV